jgi:hypothetical protein
MLNNSMATRRAYHEKSNCGNGNRAFRFATGIRRRQCSASTLAPDVLEPADQSSPEESTQFRHLDQIAIRQLFKIVQNPSSDQHMVLDGIHLLAAHPHERPSFSNSGVK